MRIAILTTVHSVLDVRIFYKQAISLASAGYDVTIVGPLDSLAEKPLSEAGITYLPLLPPIGRTFRGRQWMRLIQLLSRSDFHIWHFHDPELLPLSIILKWVIRKKVWLIYDIHEDVPKNFLVKPWIPTWLRRSISVAADIVEGWGIKRCDLVVAATDSIAERAHKFTKRMVTVRNYPIEVYSGETFARPSSSTVQMIYAGQVTPMRGLREVVQAMALVQDCKVILHLVGLFYPDKFEREIRAIAGPNVRIYGKVSFEETMTIMKSCDIGIVTLHPMPGYLESLPIKLFEYMQNGLSVIASDFPLWIKILKETGCGLTVDPLKPEEIAIVIRKLVNNPELRQKMGKSGMQMVRQKYSWLHEEQFLIQAYQRLVNE